jgi:hypothetical protein
MSTLQPQPLGIPAPNPSARSLGYWEACARKELTYQRCIACGFIGLRSFVLCGDCGGRESERLLSAGSGKLYSWTIVWRAPSPGFNVPYAPAVVELDEGFFVVSSIVGCEPEDLQDGLRVQVEFHPASEEIWLPYFTPMSQA